jgi:hypothetical protein
VKISDRTRPAEPDAAALRVPCTHQKAHFIRNMAGLTMRQYGKIYLTKAGFIINRYSFANASLEKL